MPLLHPPLPAPALIRPVGFLRITARKKTAMGIAKLAKREIDVALHRRTQVIDHVSWDYRRRGGGVPCALLQLLNYDLGLELDTPDDTEANVKWGRFFLLR